jgi:cytoskeleton protein RodZ
VIAEREPASSATGVSTLLRETRVKLGRDIAVAATTLRIRQPYLEAIEEGRYQDLPGSTYAVGFVRGYAEYLGLDGAEIVRRFKQENNDLAGRAELVFPSATSGGGIPTGALLILALVGAGIAYGAWVWLQDRNETVAEAVPPLPERLAALIHKPVDAPADNPPAAPAAAPQPQPAEQAPATPAVAANTQPEAGPAAEPAPPPAAEPAQQPEAVPAPEPAKPAKPVKAKKAEAPPPPAPAPAPAAAEGDNPTASAPAAAIAASADAPAAPPADAPKKVVWKPSKRIKITANADCWIKIRDAQGQMVLSRLLHAGDSFTPPGNAGLVMTVGNAAALTMVVDGKERPPLGAEGVVKHIALDPDKADADVPAETSPSNN